MVRTFVFAEGDLIFVEEGKRDLRLGVFAEANEEFESFEETVLTLFVEEGAVPFTYSGLWAIEAGRGSLDFELELDLDRDSEEKEDRFTLRIERGKVLVIIEVGEELAFDLVAVGVAVALAMGGEQERSRLSQ